jgi:hypothetical protein
MIIAYRLEAESGLTLPFVGLHVGGALRRTFERLGSMLLLKIKGFYNFEVLWICIQHSSIIVVVVVGCGIINGPAAVSG